MAWVFRGQISSVPHPSMPFLTELVADHLALVLLAPLPEWLIAPSSLVKRNESNATLFTFRIARGAKKMISKTTPDRSKIIIEHEDHIKYWSRHFGVTKDELTRAIERVGNSAAAVRKQLSAPRPPAT
jgi:Protein of unknown function (DUF3606)